MRILYLDIDTLRPDHMSCYGYPRLTTPNLDRVAREGVRFDRFYCSDAPCLPSRAALVSGMFGIHNGAVGHGGTAGDRRLIGESRGFADPIDRNNFHWIFRKAGLHTASISTFAERHSSFWYTAGFHEVYNVGKGGMESGEEVIPIALDWVERNAQKDNWYLHLHLWDPHTPYRTPADYVNPFENEPLPADWITEEVFEKHLRQIGPHGLNEISMYDDVENPKFPKHPGAVRRYEQLRRVIDGYDCGIRYADELLGQVLDALREKGVYDDLAIIVTSDHGENMGELGIYGEHGTADEATCHIPMLIKWPGAQRGQVDAGFHYLLDLPPTVAELLNVPAYPKWDGASFAQALRGGEDQGRPYLVLSQMAHVCQRSVRFEDWLYVRTYHDGFRLLDREMLFNLNEDPHEQHDVKAEHPEVCGQGARYLLDWQDEMMLSSDSAVDPLWTVLREGGPFHTVGQLEHYCGHLERTGRAEGARLLREKYGKS
ncbi:MAG TPA: sulfatase [Clostridia bacterium]|nr:sulfatase [Clostridia bacterium]